MSRAMLAFVAVFALFASAEAKITVQHITHESRPVVLINRPFGFLEGGVINIELWDAKVFKEQDTNDVNLSRLGFFITTAEAETELEGELSEGACLLDDLSVDRLFTFQEMQAAKDAEGHYFFENHIQAEQGGEYSLFFSNCEPNTVVSFDIRVGLYNEGANGARDYLSAGEAPLPTVYFVMFILYVLCCGIWAYTVYYAGTARQRIHYLMLILVFFKALTVLAQSGKFWYIRHTGDAEGWNIAYYVFTFIRGIFLFTVIVLIGTGWSFLKPFLQDKEKKVILVVVPLQVFANVAEIILDESGPAEKGWFTWRDIFHLLDIICCCAILFPIVWSIKHLREAATTDGKAARNIQKLTLFRQFYVMVVSYIYFTRIVVYLLRSTTPFMYVWLADTASEIATLAFYCITGYMFRPNSDNPYLHLKQDEIDELEEMEVAKLREEEGLPP